MIGPGGSLGIAAWDAEGAHGVEEILASGSATLTRPRAIELGLGEAWALVDYHDAVMSVPVVGMLGMRDLHRVDGTTRFVDLAPALEAARAQQEIVVASHAEETSAAMEALGFATPTPTTALTAARFDGVDVFVTIVTTFMHTEMRTPCGGAPQPPAPMNLGGIAWERTYRIARDGSVHGVGDAVMRQRMPTVCDPRLP